MEDLAMFCNSNRIHLDGGGWQGSRGGGKRGPSNGKGGGKGDGKGGGYRGGRDRDDRGPPRRRDSYSPPARNQGKGQSRGQDRQSKGGNDWGSKGGKGESGGRDQRGGRQAPARGGGRGQDNREKKGDGKDKKGGKVADAKVDKSAKDTNAAAPAEPASNRYYGPLPPNSRSARRSKIKIRLGTKGLKKLTELDGKKWDKKAPAYTSSLELLANAFSFLPSAERWKLRAVAPAFALAFQQDAAWTSASLEPTWSFDPFIKRDTLPTQLDVMHKHKDVLQVLTIRGFDGLQGALLQNFTAMTKLYIHSSKGCSGLSYVPKSLTYLRLELCHLIGYHTEELEALKASHPALEVVLVKCTDKKSFEVPATKGEEVQRFVNTRMIAGVQYGDAN